MVYPILSNVHTDKGGGGQILGDFVRTSFMDGPLSFLIKSSKIQIPFILLKTTK